MSTAGMKALSTAHAATLRAYFKPDPTHPDCTAMHTQNLSAWTHSHVFDAGNQAAERGTRLVMWITLAMMIVEIAAGLVFNSMALLADGWHMSSHALAIGLSAFAYAAARRLSQDGRFSSGPGRSKLAAFASAIFLLGVAGLMVFGSVERLFTPADSLSGGDGDHRDRPDRQPGLCVDPRRRTPRP
jgi:hypothetical protein